MKSNSEIRLAPCIEVSTKNFEIASKESGKMKSHSKRKFGAIDLTGDEDGSSSQSRRAPGMDEVTQSQRDSWLEQAEEHEAEDIIMSSQHDNETAMTSYQLYGK